MTVKSTIQDLKFSSFNQMQEHLEKHKCGYGIDLKSLTANICFEEDNYIGEHKYNIKLKNGCYYLVEKICG